MYLQMYMGDMVVGEDITLFTKYSEVHQVQVQIEI
jgi:hypothetical protein